MDFGSNLIRTLVAGAGANGPKTMWVGDTSFAAEGASGTGNLAWTDGSWCILCRWPLTQAHAFWGGWDGVLWLLLLRRQHDRWLRMAITSWRNGINPRRRPRTLISKMFTQGHTMRAHNLLSHLRCPRQETSRRPSQGDSRRQFTLGAFFKTIWGHADSVAGSAEGFHHSALQPGCPVLVNVAQLAVGQVCLASLCGNF